MFKSGLSRRGVIIGAGAFLARGAAAAAAYNWERSAPGSALDVKFLNKEQQEVTIAQFKGKPVLINIWASWCIPCLLELPALDRFARFARQEGVVTLAVSLDQGGWPVVRPIWQKLRMGFAVPLLDQKGTVNQAVNLQGLPTSIIIDANGALIARRRGSVDWDSPTERDLARSILRS